MIGIIDYGVGNLASVRNALQACHKESALIKDPQKVATFDRIILPGVGAFGNAMEHLRTTGMDEAVIAFAKSGNPMLGICLGMQLLFSRSDEFGSHIGLGLIDGEIKRFDKAKMQEDSKIPHVGWNRIFFKKNPLFEGLTKDPYLYFVHSYHAITDEKNVIAETIYGYKFAAAVNSGNIFGLQPHPEKSHDNGLRILKNFTEIVL